MEAFQPIKTLGQIKILADARRLVILQLLMGAPATLTQLGRILGEHPAWVRHHLKQLEDVGLVEIVDIQVSGGFVEKYYRAKARTFSIQEVILPRLPGREILILAGSHDLALEMLAWLPGKALEVLTIPVGSLEGLISLRQGACQMAGCHLFDQPSGEYNTPFIRHLFPDRSTALVTMAHREQGLLVAAGNPRRMHGLQDLQRSGLTFINRNRGSGTRLWLDGHLSALGISPQQVRGYTQEVRTHTEVAMAVQEGRADAGLGIRAAALAHDLDFIPLFQERFDLVYPLEQAANPSIQILFNMLASSEFRRGIESLGGYDTTHTGSQIENLI